MSRILAACITCSSVLGCSAADTNSGSSFASGGQTSLEDGGTGASSGSAGTMAQPPPQSPQPPPVAGSGGSLGLPPGDGDQEEPPSSCAEHRERTTPDPVGILIVLDQSGSMTEFEDRWTPVTDALKAFVTDPSVRDLAVGLQYFPRQAATQRDPAICLPETYATPEVDLDTLTNNASALVGSIVSHHFTSAESHDPEHWGTPTKAAVEAGLATLKQWAAEQPGRRPVLLLATDGEPTSFCSENDIPSIAGLIGDAAIGTPGIATYVIGIGEIANLDQLAAAAGTGQSAFVVSSSGGQTTRDEFIEALQAIRGLTLPCDYAIPNAADVDRNKVNVEYRPTAGAPFVLPRASSPEACPDDEPSWYYDNPAAPKRVVLCHAACDELNRTAGAVHLVYGCATQTVK